jgi:hypothetical protein
MQYIRMRTTYEFRSLSSYLVAYKSSKRNSKVSSVPLQGSPNTKKPRKYVFFARYKEWPELISCYLEDACTGRIGFLQRLGPGTHSADGLMESCTSGPPSGEVPVPEEPEPAVSDYSVFSYVITVRKLHYRYASTSLDIFHLQYICFSSLDGHRSRRREDDKE